VPLRLFANASLSGADPVRAVRDGVRLRLPGAAVPAAGARVPPAAHRAGRAAVHRPDDRIGERALILAGFACDAGGLAGWRRPWHQPAATRTCWARCCWPEPASARPSRPRSRRPCAVPAPQVGLASGIGSTFQNVGGVFGVATATAIFATAGSYLSPADFTAGLRPTLLALAGLGAAGLLAGLTIRPGPQPGPAAGTDPLGGGLGRAPHAGS